MGTLSWGSVLASGLLTLRLVDLQLLHGERYRRLAEQNRLRLVPEQAARGVILDRDGAVLATNQTAFRVALVPQEVEDLRAVLGGISALARRPISALEDAYRKERTVPFLPATVLARVSKDVAVRLEEERWRLPGLLIKPEAVRHYPLGSTAAHLLGYLSQPTEEELPRLKAYGVHPTYLVGRTGLERLWDRDLAGQPGGLMVEVNHRARQVRVLGRRAPIAGELLTLTIDATLQALIEQGFGDQAGACVVLDPGTGEVLSMVSRPAFSPEAMSTPDPDAVRDLLNDPGSPLMNRATVGVYQPGSIMKLLTAVAALEQGLITPTTTIVCRGSVTIGDRAFHCWNRDGHGPLILREELMQSNSLSQLPGLLMAMTLVH